ncbi:MAG: radical SAM protein [Planctomycetota bacterium]|nr:MAG: radical SAM protein [Planctomycetota bacterium]
MIYEGQIYRPPSEHDAWILQASIGCSWNKCSYCEMYRDKEYRERPLPELLAEVAEAKKLLGPRLRKVFVADGDALNMPLSTWEPLLAALRQSFPKLARISAYAMASNVTEKSPEELRRLRQGGLSRLYLGPESGDDLVLRRIAKGSNAAEHIEAASRLRRAGIEQSVIFLLGAGGVERSQEHAQASAELATAMDPEFLAALTLTLKPGTSIWNQYQRGRFRLPDSSMLLRELRSFLAGASPSNALFRSNHASNHVVLGGRLPKDREQLLRGIDQLLSQERRWGDA